MTNKTFKQKLKQLLLKPYKFKNKKYKAGQKLVTFKTLVHSKNIKDVINQIHLIDSELAFYSNKIGQGRMLGGLEVTRKGLPAMKYSQARRWRWLLQD